MQLISLGKLSMKHQMPRDYLLESAVFHIVIILMATHCTERVCLHPDFHNIILFYVFIIKVTEAETS